MDQFTEVSGQSWFDRIKNAIGGVIFGIILFLASFVLIFWNEGRAVQTAQSLTEGSKACVAISCDKVNPANDSKLVHLTGEATTTEQLTDNLFRVSENALVLDRRVEMFQWFEEEHSRTRDKPGGGTETETTYTYDMKWSDNVINSSSFHDSRGHENPPSMPFQSERFVARNATIGAFALTPELLEKIDDFQSLPMEQKNVLALPPDLRNRFRAIEGTFFSGRDPMRPNIGDLRITYGMVKPTTVSIVGQQTGGGFQQYQTKAGDPLLMLKVGQVNADEMFKQAHEANTTLTWILRVVAFIMMFIGLMMLANPLVVLADVVPFLGGIVGGGAFLFAGLISVALWTGTVAISWIVFRPVLGVALLVVTVGAIVGFVSIMKNKKKDNVTA